MTDEELAQLRSKLAEINRELKEPNLSSRKKDHLVNERTHYSIKLAAELQRRGVEDVVDEVFKPKDAANE